MEEKAAALRAMRICRFCLTDKDPLTNIYEKENSKNSIPLPLQIMACVTIEVFANDGMPQLICDECRLQTRKSYSFKTMCRRSDDILKSYLTTGVLPKQETEEVLKSHPNNVQKRASENDETIAVNAKRTKTADTSIQVNLNTEEIQPESIEECVEETIVESTDIIPEAAAPAAENDEDSAEMVPEYLVETDLPIDSFVSPKLKKPKAKATKQILTHVFPCTECERSFPLQQLLDIHVRQHTRERKFTCGECSKKFFTKNDLAKHVLIHTGEKPFACVACDKTFSRINLLHRHEKTHISVPKYLCTYCDKTYLNAEDLAGHIETHKKKRPFKCAQCAKCFAFKQGLERHEMGHFTENRHKCNYCEDSFNTAGKLARHIQTHAGARPYPCKLCHRTFLLSHHLTRHLRLHYRNKNTENECGEYKCDHCSMSFRRKDSLIHHTAIHSMVNLKCVICNKEFADVTNVKEHVNTHLSGLQYPCDKCDYSFETQDELEQHDLKHALQEDQEIEEDEYIPQDLERQDNDDMEEERLDPDFDMIDPDQEQFPVRRSLRNVKVKNYADFLKDELPDTDDENYESEEEYEPPKIQIGMIPPVIRSETMKTYERSKDKSSSQNKSPIITKESELILPDQQQPSAPTKPPETVISIPKSITKITTLEHLGITKQTLDAMTKESGIVEMKVGQKIVRVQPLKMTKSVYEAMAKKGQLERKGSKIVVQNIGKGLDLNKLVQLSKTNPDTIDRETPDVDMESNIAKTPVRTYVKKIVKIKDDPQIFAENVISQTIEVDQNTIDLDNSINDNDTSLQQVEILGKFD